MSDWRNFTNKVGSSSKFWKFRYVEGGKSVEKEWGRIGGRVDHQTKKFPNEYSAQHYVEQEVSKKVRKGYVEETAEQLQEQTEVAQTLGTRWKINRMEFLSGSFGGPDVGFGENYTQAGVFVEMLESWSKERVWLLVNKDDAKQFGECAYSINGAHLTRTRFVDSNFVLGVRKSIRNLQEVVEQALVKFAAAGARTLDLGFGTTTATDVDTRKAIRLVAAQIGTSEQVVEKFAAIGARRLEI